MRAEGCNGKRRSTISVILDSFQRERPFNPFDLASIHNVIPPPFRPWCLSRSLPHRGETVWSFLQKFDSSGSIGSPFLDNTHLSPPYYTPPDTQLYEPFVYFRTGYPKEMLCWVRRNGGSRIPLPCPAFPPKYSYESNAESNLAPPESYPVHTRFFSR